MVKRPQSSLSVAAEQPERSPTGVPTGPREGEALEPVRFAVAVDVMPKEGISDPQGQTIERALPSLGFADVHDVRVGKRIELVVVAPDEGGSEAIVRAA